MLDSHCCIFRDGAIFISGLHRWWWHGFGTWTKLESSDRLLVMSSLCLQCPGKAPGTDCFPDFSFLSSFLFFFFPQNMKSHFHTKSTFGVSYPSNVITKVAGDRFAQTDTAWLDTRFQLSQRGFCAASHWISLLRNFLSLQQTLSRAPFL